MVSVVEYLSAAVNGKPIDSSDVTTLEEARAELTRLRRVANRVCSILDKTGSSGDKGDSSDNGKPLITKKKKAHRRAVAEDDSYKDYQKVVVPKSNAVRKILKSAIRTNILFKGCTEEDLDDFVDVFVQKDFAAGTTVIKQGDEGDTFYVVESGALNIFINVGSEGEEKTETQVGIPYGPAMGFGELALVYGSPRAATIRCEDDCVVWDITRAAYKGLRLKHEQKAHNLKLFSLRNVKIGEKTMGNVLSASDIESMALAVNTQSFANGDAIVREGEKGDMFYVITKGSVDVSKAGKALATLGVNNFFGEKALLSSDTRNATCVAATNVECLTLLRADFVLLLGNLEDLLAGKRGIAKAESFAMEAEKTHYTMAELEKGGVLGEGAFGKVNLVKSKKDGKLFALKAQSKAFLVKHGQESHTLAEYKLLRKLKHPLIVNIYQAMQDKKYVYFLMTLLPGGELMDLLDSKRRLPESWTRFYGATVLSCFETIHSKKIAYRDLKPENLVLDANGYCYLIDFGLAKVCEKGKTWTFCGTPDYLAPEIIRGKGHDWGVDYWGFGVFLYELTEGQAPFYADDPSNTARKIIKGKYSTPSNFSKPLGHLIKKLLCEQSKRLGRTKGGPKEIVQHEWFSGFNWDSLLGKKMAVPWKPKVGNLERLGRLESHVAEAPDSRWNPVFSSE